jgi:hypothetical protein
MPQLPTAPFYPSRLGDPRYAADLKQLLWSNFFIINEGPGFSRQPTRIDGQPTTVSGPPNFGTHYVNALWVDGLRSVWYCIHSGTWGTSNPAVWVQSEVPILTSFPTSVQVGYRVIRSDLGYAQYYWDGSTWVALYSPGAITAADNLGTLAADGQGVYSTTTSNTLLFRRIKSGDNITLVSNPNSIEVAVQEDPYFKGTTTVDIFKILAGAAPDDQTDDSVVSWVETSGVTPNKTMIWKCKWPDGVSVILSSRIL